MIPLGVTGSLCEPMVVTTSSRPSPVTSPTAVLPSWGVGWSNQEGESSRRPGCLPSDTV